MNHMDQKTEYDWNDDWKTNVNDQRTIHVKGKTGTILLKK
jgi:hypothetical protein